MQFMECVPLLDEVNEALECRCLQWATAGSAGENHDVEEQAGDRAAVAAGK